MKSKFMKLFSSLILVSALFVGCDNSSKDRVITNNKTEQSHIQVSESIKDQKDIYKDRKFEITDVSEMSINGAYAIAITFSTPIKENQNFNSLINIYDKTQDKEVDGSWELSKAKNELLLKYIEPNTQYEITMNNLSKVGIINIAGKDLNDYASSSKVFKLKTSNVDSIVGFSSLSSLLPYDIADGLPISAINVDHINVDFYRVDDKNIVKFVDALYAKSIVRSWRIEDLLTRDNKLVYSARYDLNTTLNVKENIIVPIKDIKELQKSGVYIAIMNDATKYYSYTIPATLFTITDIGVSVHKSRDGYEIFTQNIKNGKILPNVDIKIIDNFGAVIAQNSTNQKGYLRLNTNEKDAILIASLKGQTSFIYLKKAALDLAEFPISGGASLDKSLFVFGPRDIYRPGESALFNALLRDSDGKMIKQQPIQVQIVQADNKVLKTFTWQGEDGFFNYKFNIPASAPTGEWRLKFNLGDTWDREYKFKVEDFLPEKMALEINATLSPLDVNSDVIFNIYGKYLYGAPASGNKLTGKLSLRPVREAVKELPGFIFGSVTEEELRRSLSTIDTALNNEGKLEVRVNNSWRDILSPVTVLFEASLLESGGRPVTRTVKQDIWPSEKLPALKPTFEKKRFYDYDADKYVQQYSVDSDSYAQFEVIFADFKGQKYKKENLQVTLIKERRNYYWYQNDNGWSSSYTQKNIAMESFDISTKDGESTKVGFNVEWGPYIIEILDKETGASSSLHFNAGYSWQDSTSKAGSRPEQIKLKIDKPNYKAGEIAKVSVNSPDAGVGYLMVENSDGILWWQEINVPKEGKTFEIPVNKEWNKHDLYISAMVVREADKKVGASVKRAIGLLHLPLYRDDRRIDFSISTQEKIEPNTQTKVKIKADLNKEQMGKKVKAIVSAVDSGILSITQFETPDPFDAFFGKRRFELDIYDVYGNIIEGDGKLATFKFGGDMEADEALSRAGKKPITKVQIVALQSEVVTLDENGEAEITFNIPDFNGELRFMAQVWSDEDYASSEEKSIVAADIIIELAHPRFLAGTDKTTLALDLNNLSGKDQVLKVDVKTDGLLSLDKVEQQTISVLDKQKTVLHLPLTTLNGYGNGNVIVKVSGIKGKDGKDKVIERKWTIGVRPPYPAETFSLIKALQKGESLGKLEFEKGYLYLDPSTTESKVTITSIPPLSLSSIIGELFAYPYGCLEQTVSGLYPSVFTSTEQLHALGIKTSTDKERRENIEKGIIKLVGMQKPNGSFGSWYSGSYEALWGSVYATDFLINAKKHGYDVPAQTLNNAIERLQYYVNNNNLDHEYSEDRSFTHLSVKAYAALVLAKIQKAPLGNLRRIYDMAEQSTSPLATMQLGIALKLMGDNERADVLLRRSSTLDTNNRGSRWYGDYGSPIRDKAQMLALMYEYDLFKDKRGQLLLDLSNSIKRQSYLSTQERNSIFLAGRHLLDNSEVDWRVSLDENGKHTNIDNHKKTFYKNYDYKGITSLRSITNNDAISLYATVNIIGYPLNAPKPYSNKVNIQRSYYSIEGDKIELDELKSGDLIFVVLDITTQLTRLPDALVVDLLPAGLELENQNLGHSSISIGNSVLLSKNNKLARSIEETTIFHQEFRDDRYVAAINVLQYKPATLVYLARAVTPGSYKVPPPYVESMYSPEFFAIGKTPSILHIK